MSGFSPEWLALREPVDHRSRSVKLANRLRSYFGEHREVRVVDLGCGSGSNIRATSALLPNEQVWTLVDYDPRLLADSRAKLGEWADNTERNGDALLLRKGPRSLTVRFKEADLNRELDAALGVKPDLVTASAFFDLCSAAFIDQIAQAVAARRAMFFTVLTYNGEQEWTPPHPADAEMREAFKSHQLGDKGFGASAGWMAPGVLAAAFERAGYGIEESDSPWRLGPEDTQLIGDLASGFAGAVAALGTIDPKTIANWRKVPRRGAIVGHTDTLALPAEGVRQL